MAPAAVHVLLPAFDVPESLTAHCGQDAEPSPTSFRFWGREPKGQLPITIRVISCFIHDDCKKGHPR